MKLGARPNGHRAKAGVILCCDHKNADHQQTGGSVNAQPGAPCTVCALSGGPCKGWIPRNRGGNLPKTGRPKTSEQEPDGPSVAAIAREMGVTRGAVSLTLNRALRKLRRKLERERDDWRDDGRR